MNRFPFVCAILLTLGAACAGAEGPAGPAGPQGAQGPQGTPGTANVLMVTALADGVGDADATLPSSVGTNPAVPPSVACYETDDASSGIWLSVSDGYSDISSYCAVVFTAGSWRVGMRQMIPGWTAGWVVTY